MSPPDRPTAVTGSGGFYGGTAAARWIARNLYIGGYFAVIGALLGHPPVYGSNYAIRADAWAELRDLVHRDRADLHDDLDLAWWLHPGMTVVRDRALVVGVSARPFDSLPEIARRLRMAFHTLGVEWRAWPPFERDERRAPRAPPTSRRVLAEAADDRRRATAEEADRPPRSAGRRPPTAYAGLLEEGRMSRDELVGRRLARAVAGGVHREARADLPGEPLVELARPEVVLPDRDELRHGRGGEFGAQVGGVHHEPDDVVDALAARQGEPLAHEGQPSAAAPG